MPVRATGALKDAGGAKLRTIAAKSPAVTVRATRSAHSLLDEQKTPVGAKISQMGFDESASSKSPRRLLNKTPSTVTCKPASMWIVDPGKPLTGLRFLGGFAKSRRVIKKHWINSPPPDIPHNRAARSIHGYWCGFAGASENDDARRGKS